MNVEGSSSRSGEVGEFDFAAYIAGYHGFAKAVKCRFIAEKSPKLAVRKKREARRQRRSRVRSAETEKREKKNPFFSRLTPFEVVAFHTLIQEIQTGFNVHFYKSAVAALVPELGLDYQADAQWLTNADKKAAAIYEKHDQQLTAAKTNLNKLAVRAAQFALGDYYVQRGEFNSAVKCYMRCRDDCKDPPSSFALYMRIVRAHLLAGQFVQAANYASRAERAAEALPPSEVRASYLAGVAGLAALVSRAYRNAARDLCNVRLPPSQDDAPASVPVSADKKAAANDDDDDDVDDKKPQKAAAKESAKVPAALSDAPSDGRRRRHGDARRFHARGDDWQRCGSVRDAERAGGARSRRSEAPRARQRGVQRRALDDARGAPAARGLCGVAVRVSV
jgi:tetratricopeptide (TPR) repeat protein